MKAYVYTKIHAKMFIEVSFIIIKNWKHSKFCSTGKWVSKLWLEYYSTGQRNRPLMYATHNMGKFQMHYAKKKKVTYYSIDLSSWKSQYYGNKNPITGCQGLGWGTECKGACGNFLGWRKCYVSWLWWGFTDSYSSQTQQTVHFRWMNFTTCKFYLNKPYF